MHKIYTPMSQWIQIGLFVILLLNPGRPISAQAQDDPNTVLPHQLYLPLINNTTDAVAQNSEDEATELSPTLPPSEPDLDQVVTAAALTGWKLPSANAVVTGGDNNGFESFPAYAYGATEPNGQLAGDWSSGTCTSFPCTNDSKRDQHRFSNFNFAIPTNATILGIQVRLDTKAVRSNNTACTTPQMGMRLSKNGGSSWTAYKYATITSYTWPPSIHYLGAQTDKWGTTWTSTSFSNANFQVQIINKANNTDCSFYLDALQVQVNYNAVTLPTLAINSISANEGSGSMTFNVTLSAASTQNVTFNYATANGTATAGTDYTAQSGVKTIAAGSTATTISVPIINDTVVENNETFNVILSNPSSNVTVANGQGTGTILNDDTLPTLSVNNMTVNEGAGNVKFTVSLSAPSNQPVTFGITSNDGTALVNSDYVDNDIPTVTLSPGGTSWDYYVGIVNDTMVENNETFTVILSNPSSNVTIAGGQGVGTITDNDTNDTGIALPTLQFQPLGDYSLPTAKKALLPPLLNRGEGFGEWPNAHLIPECVEAHDRYWVYAPDNRAFPTWHPVTEMIMLSNGQQHLCEYGHEHGSNPAVSPAFSFFGGWPPFGYIMQQQPTPQGHPQHRHEDHVGHKVNVATFRAAFGKPQEAGTPLYDAGFNCHFISKIHQGTWSIDAFPNYLHEYYLAVACNDVFTPDPSRPSTWFSVKRMAVFGNPNTFIKICPSYTAQALDALLDFAGVPIPATTITTPAGSGNREFQCFNTDLKDKQPTQLAQPELWTGLSPINTGTGSLFFAPYYIVKNPARLYDGASPHQVRHTIDYCYDTNGNAQYLTSYCIGAPPQKPAWNSAASPFKGTLRAVNFKEMQLYNLGGNREVCTDAFGAFLHVATATTPCNYQAGEVYQAISPTNNEWLSSLHCYNGKCGEIHGSLENALPDPQPNDPNRYKAPGIGFEHLEFHDHPSVHGQN